MLDHLLAGRQSLHWCQLSAVTDTISQIGGSVLLTDHYKGFHLTIGQLPQRDIFAEHLHLYPPGLPHISEQ